MAGKTLETLTRRDFLSLLGLGGAGALLPSGCATAMMYAFRNYDINADGTMDLIDDSFSRDYAGRTIYNFRLRRGNGGGTSHDPGSYKGEVRGSVVLPPFSDRTLSVTYFMDVDGDGEDEMVVVERRADRFDLYARELSRTSPNPAELPVVGEEPAHVLDGERDPGMLYVRGPIALIKNRAVEPPRRTY